MGLSGTVAAHSKRRNPSVGSASLTTGGDRRYRIYWLIAIFVAVLHAFMAVTAVNTKSPTFDEPQHLTAGYSYWVRNDFRLDPENGNLPARWAALPLLFSSTQFVPLNDRAWQRADQGRTAHQFLYEVGNDPDRMIADARMMMSIFGVALCLLIFRIGREFFGVLGGLVAETIAAFDPNFLAHSALVTSDVAATFFFLASIWSCWRLFETISPARFAIAAFSLSGLFLTKFSAPIALPVLGLISILQIFRQREIALQFALFRIALTERWKKASTVGALCFVLGSILFLAIWGSFSFRYSAWTDNQPNHESTTWHWNFLLEGHGTFENAVTFARTHHLLPEAYLYGLAYVRKHKSNRPAFLDNQWSIVGFRSFFPRAFIYKTSLPVLGLLAVAVYAAIVSRERWKSATLLIPLSIFVLAYGAFAIASQLNIGHRHLLPIYPTLFIACGAAGYLVQQNRRSTLASAVAILLLWQIGESIAISPNYLAYFNEIANGPSRGYQHLVDSSLDWGQDLPALKSWIDSHATIVDGKPLYLAYFGTADPRWHDIDAKSLSTEKPWQHNRAPSPLIGGIYCVSATTLQSVYSLEVGPWCERYERRYQSALAEMRHYPDSSVLAWISNDPVTGLAKKIREFERLRLGRLCSFLRYHQPLAQVGYSIFVFMLDDDELNRALYGPPAELTPDDQVIGY